MGEDISEMEDLCDSKDYYIEIPSDGFRTGIFWDADACPFPKGIRMDPDVIYQKIESALIERGSPAKISVVAYVDDKKPFWDEFLRKKKTWKASICFQPLGLKPAMRMLNDTLLWVRRSLPPANLIFVSDKVYPSDLLTGRLRSLVCCHYRVHIVEPNGRVQNPGSLFDDHMTELERKEVNPAKRRAVEEAAAEGSED